ncbi:MAG TPA: hypothetical protein VGM65_06210 [Candidatus Udaeobacter sp.]
MKTDRLSLVLIIFAFAVASSASAQSLFVTNRYSNNVAVIDSSTNQVLTEIPVGTFPIRIAMTPNKLKAFVSNADSNNISVLDTVEAVLKQAYRLERLPHLGLVDLLKTELTCLSVTGRIAPASSRLGVSAGGTSI